MSLFKLFNKTNSSINPIADNSLYELSDKRDVLGEFTQQKNYRGFKRVNISNHHYPEALKNLKKISETMPHKKSVGINGGTVLDLSDSKLTLYLSESIAEKKPVILLYLNDMFIGSNIVNSDKAKSALNSLQCHKTDAAHVEIEYGKSDNSMVYVVYLMFNGL